MLRAERPCHGQGLPCTPIARVGQQNLLLDTDVPQGTRSGDLDPGVVLYLLRTARMSVDALDELVNRQSGLVGMSGTSADVRDLLAREANDPDAADALAVFCHRTRQAIGALAATNEEVIIARDTMRVVGIA